MVLSLFGGGILCVDGTWWITKKSGPFRCWLLGGNSIAASAWRISSREVYFETKSPLIWGCGLFKIFGEAYEPLVAGAGTVLLVLWALAFCFWMQTRKNLFASVGKEPKTYVSALLA